MIYHYYVLFMRVNLHNQKELMTADVGVAAPITTMDHVGEIVKNLNAAYGGSCMVLHWQYLREEARPE